MATLVRPSHVDHDTPDLKNNIPTPFPVQHLHDLDDDALDDLAAEPVDYDDADAARVAQRQNDIQASVAAVHHSCLMTLASILSLSSPLDSAAHPDDSEQLNGTAISVNQMLAESPLSCLVHVLRTRLGHPDQPDQPLVQAALLPELRDLVDEIAPFFDKRDALLAQSVVTLLLDFEQLPASLTLPSAQLVSQSGYSRDNEKDIPSFCMSPYATITSLQRQLSSLQPSVASTSSQSRLTPAESVRTALLWARIDERLETVVSLCRARAASPPQNDMTQSTAVNPVTDSPESQNWSEGLRTSFDDTLPPEYDSEYHHRYPYECPPSYVAEGHVYAALGEKPADEKHFSERTPLENVSPRVPTLALLEETGITTERDHSNALDLDRITHAIERLYVVAPQLMNQRVELRREKVMQMEKAKNAKIKGKGKGKGRMLAEVADPELDKMLDLLGRASAREIPDQSVDINPQRTARDGGTTDMEEQRRKYLEHLVHRASSGRLHSQDAVLSITRTLSSEPKSRPLLAPSKAVRSFSGRLRAASKSRSRPTFASREDVSHGALDVAYVAEHHETLKHVLLFITHASPSSSAFNGLPSAEVLPSTSSGTHGDCLFLRLGSTPSPPLALPVPVIPGSKSVISRGNHWEIKASCHQCGVPPQESEEVALLPASDLLSLSPSSYVCSSCSLPLIPAPPTRYRDLPSEHWEELIDAWMCHPEGQTLAKTGKGSVFWIWPTRDEALVGGSYVLFDTQAIAGGNIKCEGVRERGGNTRLARCLCGVILGRQYDRRQEDGSVSRMYRLFKYAIRPISTMAQVPKIPMSAFVLHDMLEHVQAHATYRFALLDEENEKPRLLIWLFKPRIRVSYMLPTPILLPKSGSVDASKVLYKIVGPTSSASDLKEILNKHPGFPQAEYLFYPMDVCQKLVALLKESTTSYPESMRTMTGLDVGWLTMM